MVYRCMNSLLRKRDVREKLLFGQGESFILKPLRTTNETFDFGTEGVTLLFCVL